MALAAKAKKADVYGSRDHYDEGGPHYKHAYNHEARMLTNSDIPKRSLAIAKEVSIVRLHPTCAFHMSTLFIARRFNDQSPCCVEFSKHVRHCGNGVFTIFL